MIDLLVNLLSPILGGYGVSQADLQQYAESLSGYIYAIVILLVLVIVVMIAAHWVAKKGSRHVVRWTAGVALVAAIAIIANIICFGPMYANVSGFMNASKVELSDETVSNSEAVIKETGEEGMVLVKNNGLLPLSGTSALNVFGWDSTNPLYGGTGSGSSDSSTAIGIIQSLQDAGFSTNESLTQMYVDYRADRPSIAMASQDWTLPEPTVDYYTDSLMSEATSFSDTAVIVIGRSGGEGADLPTDMYAVIHGTYNIASEVSAAPDNYGYTNASYTNNGSYDDFDEGETYLELSNTEEAMIEKVCSTFDKVIVVINANNTMELGWVDEYPQIGAVILAPGTGKTGMAALGEIIAGTVNPSGKTVDTFVKDLTATPTFNNIANFSWSNVDDLKEAIVALDSAYEGNIAFVNYVEGIYVGYKFYETAYADQMDGFDYDATVQYPFGYGLSYTTFTQSIKNFSADGDNITFDVEVSNTGSTAGKDVVEVYFTPPYTNGGIEKAAVNLVDYEKTETIEAGSSATVSFSIPKEDLAAYDSECIKTANGGYILEAGDYTISIRSDSHSVLDEATFSVASDIDYSVTGRASDNTVATNQFDYAKGDVTYLSRANRFANYAEATAAPTNFEMSAETRAAMEVNTVAGYVPTDYDDSNDVMPTLGASNGLKLADLTGKSYDDPQWDDLLDQLSFDDMALMINLGGWQTAQIDSVGKIATSDCDGPAGLNNFITQAYGTAFPAEVLMAQTWSKEMATKIGDAMGREYADANNYGWYGPAMNTHRSAFAGRNFEYYSEDGVLAGKFASNQVNAAAKLGVYAYIKHFALNDQETNRCSILMTYSNEQAMREIYLKPFELVVKNYDFTSQGLAVMSSFNWLGTKPADGSYELLTTVLRDEWGFVGFVETDYDGSYGYMISDHCVRVGNDLMLGFASAATNQFTDTSATATLAMRQACKNILYVVGNSGYYADGDPTGGIDNMTKTFIGIDVGVAIVLIAIEAIVIVRWLGKKKKAAQ
jgi:beta-glucosidase